MDTAKIIVHVESKNITLPSENVTLNASTNNTSRKYSYQWTLLEQVRRNRSNGTAVLKHENKHTLTLLLPEVGEYRFKVTLVGSDGSKGEGIGTVNVYPGTLSNINITY